MRFVASVVLLLAAGARSAGAQPPDLSTFRVQVPRSRLVVRLFKAGVGSAFAHDHVIAARSFEGAIRVDPRRPETARIQITAFTDGLEADPPELRRTYSMPPLGDKDRRSVTESMRSQGQLAVGRYRTVTFVSTRVSAAGEGRYDVQGLLTIRGVSRPVRLTMRAVVSGPELRAGGHLSFRQSDFGYKPYRAMLGLVKVRDEAQMDIDVVATTAPR